MALRRGAAVLLAAVLVLAVVIVWVGRSDVAGGLSLPSSTPAGTDAPYELTASSAALGHDAELAAPDVEGDWEPQAESDGAWLELQFPIPTDVRRVVLTRGTSTPLGVRAGYLDFGDGSLVHVRLGDGETVVPVTPRRVRTVRFVVTSLDPGGALVSLAELRADGGDGTAPVATGGPEDGDVAPLATIAPLGVAAQVGDLVDGDPATTSEVGDGVELTWRRPREVTSVAVAGATVGATLARGNLVFSDGSVVPIGAVTDDPDRPTIVAFMPRVTTSVRLEVEQAAGGTRDDVTLGEVEVRQLGAAPMTSAGATNGDGRVAQLLGAAEQCASSTDDAVDERGPVVLCPTTGALVDDVVTVTVAAGPSYDSVSAVAWSTEAANAATGASPAGTDSTTGVGSTPVTTPAVVATLDADHTGTVELDLAALPAGPVVVQLTATGPAAASTPTPLQLVKSTGPPQVEPVTPGPVGRSLVYDEEFDKPLAITRDGLGADYAAAKPEQGLVTDFGDAIFADPDAGLDTVGVVGDDYLRLKMQPRPADLTDPSGWDRQQVSGMIASARPGGSGFSAQYGFFEARMLAPAQPGTWPAFWMLSNPNLAQPQPVVAEVDAVELYGHDPLSSCHTTHQFPDPRGVGVARCAQRWSSLPQAMTWHTYGVDVRPDRFVFYVDGQLVTETPAVGGADDPLFFMVNLALGGGWPHSMESVRDRAEVDVDWIRVYV